MTRESFFWHKLHSLTGVIPTGFYMLQHLTLNSFSLAGPEKFNGVIGFFNAIPKHILLVLEIGLLGIPILFHAVYGLFIVNRGEPNTYFTTKYKWSQARMYTMQRWSGILLFILLILHVISTTVNAKINGHQVIEYAAWHEKLTSNGYILLVIYMIGIVAASYHLAYGIWNFCIRWGITVSEKAQHGVQKFALAFFFVVTLLGWGALFGFLRDPGAAETGELQAQTTITNVVARS
ncbi:MAG TPA: hypothetical protein PKA27_05175 [Fimbriimonadaceae bacterium]|nr:hypothetical protein [Fimbriimonadaceae bacterium]